MNTATDQAAQIDEQIARSLEICAERAGDIVPTVFERFFAADAQAHSLMAHSDQMMQGRMLESTLELLMSSDQLGPGNYLEWELDNHIDAYAVTPGMYRSFFDSLLSVVQEGVGADWDDGYAGAWQQRLDSILAQVDAHG